MESSLCFDSNCVQCECVLIDLQAVVGGSGENVTLLTVGSDPEGPSSLLDDTGAVQGEGRIVF